MAARRQLNIDLDPEVAEILQELASDAHVSEGEILDRAVRAYDVRSVLARIRARSDLDDDQPMALAREELAAVRAARRAA
jgi:predicted transcriptional regulator